MKLLLSIIIVGILIIGYFGLKQLTRPPTIEQTTPPSPTSQELKTFQSKNLKFSIQIPSDFQTEEKFTTVNLNTQAGEILISRNGTNFTNLEEYLKDSDSKNKVEILEQENISIANYDSKLRKERYSGASSNPQRVYVIYVSNWVYSISTSSEPLYDDLDQIAQSFRYIP